MSTFANEHDIATYVDRFTNQWDDATPNLGAAAELLERLMTWTNDNSDGWPYWSKPSRAAAKLVDALEGAELAYRRGANLADIDIDAATLKRVTTPIKSFLTRQNVAPTLRRYILDTDTKEA